ncbi:Phosphate import ATP-binding protein PstB, partial [Bienertia sinuspersici]
KGKRDGVAPRHERCIDAFRETIYYCGLKDLGFCGSIFTLQRGRGLTQNILIRERLDRLLACNHWCNIHGNIRVRNFPVYNSDHAPILLSTSNGMEMWAKDPIFRFEALWLSKAKCTDVLIKWAKATFGNITKKIKNAEKKLKQL